MKHFCPLLHCSKWVSLVLAFAFTTNKGHFVSNAQCFNKAFFQLLAQHYPRHISTAIEKF